MALAPATSRSAWAPSRLKKVPRWGMTLLSMVTPFFLAAQRKLSPTYQNAAAIRPEAGMVSTQATTRLKVSPHRTAFTSCAVPTPTMAPVMVCVVDTGMPPSVASPRLMAPPMEAHVQTTDR